MADDSERTGQTEERTGDTEERTGHTEEWIPVGLEPGSLPAHGAPADRDVDDAGGTSELEHGEPSGSETEDDDDAAVDAADEEADVDREDEGDEEDAELDDGGSPVAKQLALLRRRIDEAAALALGEASEIVSSEARQRFGEEANRQRAEFERALEEARAAGVVRRLDGLGEELGERVDRADADIAGLRRQLTETVAGLRDELRGEARDRTEATESLRRALAAEAGAREQAIDSLRTAAESDREATTQSLNGLGDDLQAHDELLARLTSVSDGIAERVEQLFSEHKAALDELREGQARIASQLANERGRREQRERELSELIDGVGEQAERRLADVSKTQHGAVSGLADSIEQLGQSVESLAGRLRTARAEQVRWSEELLDRLERLERRPVRTSSAFATPISVEPQPAPSEKEAAGAAAVGEAEPVREPAPIELNSVTFEQLREHGLSVTQAARIVAHRDSRGGFATSAELDDVPGLPSDLRDRLREALGG